MYPVDQSEHIYLRSAIEKLTLNDASVSVHSDSWYVRTHSPSEMAIVLVLNDQRLGSAFDDLDPRLSISPLPSW